MSEKYDVRGIYNRGGYQELADLWEKPEETADFNDWDCNYCLLSLNKLGRYGECLEAYKVVRKRFPDSRLADNTACRAVYYLYIKSFDHEHDDPARFREQVEYILTHAADDAFSPKWPTVRAMLKAIDDKAFGPQPDMALKESYISRVDPSVLSTQERESVQEDGKVHRLSSDRESWYSEQTRCLLRLERYQDCIDCCDRALAAICRFHSNNDGWFLYRKAQSLYGLGRVDEARQLAEKVIGNGIDAWFVYELLFRLARDGGDTEKALGYACACSLADGKHDKRVRFYPEFAEFLDGQDLEREAMLHRRFTLLLRQENEWSVNQTQAGWSFTDEIAAMDKKAVLASLTLFWQEQKNRGKEFLSGQVKTILPGDRSGFITDDSGNDYYFNMKDIVEGRGRCRVGAKVRFSLVDRLDRSKGVVKPNAADISVM